MSATSSSVRPSELPPSELATILATPLACLPFPARMENFFGRRGLTLVRDLVVLAPAALLLEDNLGRKSVADSRQLFRDRYRTSWERLREATGVVSEEVTVKIPRTPAEEWASLARRLPADVLTQRIDLFDLPTRIETFARKQDLTTIEELVAGPFDELLGSRGVGRGTVGDALKRLTAACTKSFAPREVIVEPLPPVAPVDPLPPGSHWQSLLRDALRELAGC